MKKILIVDDHPLMRKGLALSLNAEIDLTVCGQVVHVGVISCAPRQFVKRKT